MWCNRYCGKWRTLIGQQWTYPRLDFFEIGITYIWVYCGKIKLNFRIKTCSATKGVDVTLYVWILCSVIRYSFGFYAEIQTFLEECVCGTVCVRDSVCTGQCVCGTVQVKLFTTLLLSDCTRYTIQNNNNLKTSFLMRSLLKIYSYFIKWKTN